MRLRLWKLLVLPVTTPPSRSNPGSNAMQGGVLKGFALFECKTTYNLMEGRMYRRLNGMLAIVAFLAMLLVIPAISTGAELNLGGGTPLWGTHTDDDQNHFDGGWLIYASIDKKVEARKWLRYGLMYNYTRIKVGVEDINTETGQTQIDPPDICYNGECPTALNGIYEPQTTTTIKTNHDWLQVHVLGPYAKPTWQITKRLKAFTMIGAGLMYVDGTIYGDELGSAGFASVGLGLNLTEHLGLSAQMLYVKGFTKHVEDIDYYAPVATLSYSW